MKLLEHQNWNEAADRLARNDLRPGDGCAIEKAGRRQVLHFLDLEPQLIHPWYTFPWWNEAEGLWYCRVQPGLVNGHDPLVPGAGPEGEDAALLDGPHIPLRALREVGGLSGNEEGVPEFFQRLGVSPPVEAPAIGLADLAPVPDLTAIQAAAEAESGARTLYAIDLWVSVARLSLTSEITIVDATGASGVVVDYQVGLDAANLERAGARPRLHTGRYEPVAVPGFDERVFGVYNDPAEDRREIATVYLLSPEGPQTERPDGTWSPFVKYATWDNLRHKAKNDPPDGAPPPIRIFTGLAAGVGDVISNQVLSSVNEFRSRVENALNNAAPEGRFWSA